MNSKILQNALEKVLGNTFQMYSFHALGGGEYNQQYKILSEQGLFFVKVQEAGKYGKVFEKEMLGILAIQKTNTLSVVKPIGTSSSDGFEFLISEFVESSPKLANFWSIFGSNLAKMHRVDNRYFGFNEDNYLEYTPQTNHRLANWSQFYLKYRLFPHIRLAAEKSFLDDAMLLKFEKYCQMAELIFPDEPPALIHGNLTEQNVMADAEGMPIVCNPSVYYGHREMDLAKSKHIGSFPAEFYEAYEKEYPLQKDWELRLDFYKMYYDLVNLNTYGSPYLPVVVQNLNKWVGESPSR
ncbi:MAG: fructosamine kinase family protein [Bacteroidota bacterium]|nr:fructosamine kinase family protein [Bacteroidota bacterium]